MEQTYHGKVEGRTIQLDDEVKLPRGTEVVVTVRVARKGSPQELLEALDRLPKVSREDVDEFLRLIEEGKLPPQDEDPFAGIFKDEE